MKLTYHTGKNFGDALNPFIFETLLPNFFDENPQNLFLGIGSILGLKRPGPEVKNVIVFSSGIGGEDNKTYGSPPSKDILKKYDFRCVRGPLTAKLFNLDSKHSVCDGAILLSKVLPDLDNCTKKYRYSYMPHIGTLKCFSGWKRLIESIGIHFINPTNDISKVIKDIRSSKILFSEAMHGAIVADTLRVPWLPVKSIKTINEFKWKDFCHSLNLEYRPSYINTLFNYDLLTGIAANKIKRFGLHSNYLATKIAKGYLYYQDLLLEKKVLKQFKDLKTRKPLLSDPNLLNSKRDQLLSILHEIEQDYS